MLKINKSQITIVKVFRKVKHKWIEYRKESGFWIFKKPAGFYYTCVIGEAVLLTEDDIKNENCYIDGNDVFYYPYIKIHLSDSTHKVRYFLTDNALDRYLEKELSGIDFITLDK
jgi:hypothetical protein